jgi:hypothetical protein
MPVPASKTVSILSADYWTAIPAGDQISALANGIGILVAILIAAIVTPAIANRKSKRDQQERILRILINTWLTPSNPEYQSAIALIPLDFKGCRDVIMARDNLIECVNIPSPSDVESATSQLADTRDHQAVLISTLAARLGFTIPPESLLNGSYITQGFIDRERLILDAMASWPRIALALERSNDLFTTPTAGSSDPRPVKGSRWLRKLRGA